MPAGCDAEPPAPAGRDPQPFAGGAARRPFGAAFHVCGPASVAGARPAGWRAARRGAADAAREGGFSLLELLVVAALVAMMVAAGTGGLRFGLRAWERAVAVSDAEIEARALRRFLAALLAGAEPLRLRGAGREAPALFEGAPGRMRFVAPLPARLAPPGLRLVSLGFEPADAGRGRAAPGGAGSGRATGGAGQGFAPSDAGTGLAPSGAGTGLAPSGAGGGLVLVLRHAPLGARRPGAAMPPDAEVEIVAEGLRAGSFGYLGPGGLARDWVGRRAPPRAVEIDLAFADPAGPVWPTLAAPLRLTAVAP